MVPEYRMTSTMIQWLKTETGLEISHCIMVPGSYSDQPVSWYYYHFFPTCIMVPEYHSDNSSTISERI